MKGREGIPTDVPEPPWQLSGPFVCVGVTFDPAEIRKRVSPQLELCEGTTGGLYHYAVREGWGLGPYTCGLAYVDVEGYDSPDGTKGKHYFTAYMSSAGHEGFSRYLDSDGLRLGEASISKQGDLVEARSGPAGAVHFDVAVRVTGRESETPLGSGVNYWVWDRDGQVIGMACAFTNRWVAADPLRAEIRSPPGDPSHGIHPKDLIWAGYIPKSTFNISAAYVLGSSLRLAQPGREAAYLALLAEIGLGAVVLRQDHRPIYLNVAAQALVGDGLLLDDGHIRPWDDAARDSLAEAIDAVLAGGVNPRPAAIALGRPSGRKPLLVQVCPLNALRLAMTSEPAVLLLVTDPDRQKSDPIRALELLGLTPSEARIAALVGSGLSPREAGHMAGNTEATVRYTLKQVYDKLDIGRQAELANLVARLEAVGS